MKPITDGKNNDQLLYFTSPSLTADGQTLVFISDRDGADRPNLFALNRATGDVRRLSANTDGRLRSYVYFNGHDNRGLGLASASLHAPSGRLYFVQGRDVCATDVRGGAPRKLATLPENEMTAFTHVSDDGRRLCVPTIDRLAFEHDGKSGSYDAAVQRLGLASHVRVFDTKTGEQTHDIEVERGWVTHVQFRPGDPEQILFNHEYCADAGERRIWLWDGSTIRKLRTASPRVGEAAARCVRDWVCHEVWTHDGSKVIYHGGYAKPDAGGDTLVGGCQFVGLLDPDTPSIAPIEVPFDRAFQRYGHFTASPTDGRLVSDGYYQPPDGSTRPGGGEWISIVKPDWQKRSVHWSPVCQHGSSWRGQDEHPHPVFSHDGTEILFTSDVAGKRAVYSVEA